MNPEKNQGPSEENQNTAWDSLNNATAEKNTDLRDTVIKKAKSIEPVRKAFSMVLLATSVTLSAVSVSSVYEQNRDKYNISTSVDNLKQDWQELKENAANTAEHIRDQINNIGKESTPTPAPIPPTPTPEPTPIPTPEPTPPIPPERLDASGNEAQRIAQEKNKVGEDNYSYSEEEMSFSPLANYDDRFGEQVQAINESGSEAARREEAQEEANNEAEQNHEEAESHADDTAAERAGIFEGGDF